MFKWHNRLGHIRKRIGWPKKTFWGLYTKSAYQLESCLFGKPHRKPFGKTVKLLTCLT